MPLFLRIARLAFQQQLSFRMSLIAGLATNFFFALIRTAVLLALYGDQQVINGMTRQSAITYVAFTQAVIAFLLMFGSFDVMATVYNGTIGSDLLRPLPLFFYWLARDLGRSLVNLLLRGVLLLALFQLFYPVVWPADALHWFFVFAALALGWLVSFAWRFLVNLSSFWTPDARGVGRIAYSISNLLSGFMMPLALYPDWFARLCKWTPFPALFYTSAEAYFGLISEQALWQALLLQLVWLGLLGGLCWLVLRAGIRRLVIQGG